MGVFNEYKKKRDEESAKVHTTSTSVPESNGGVFAQYKADRESRNMKQQSVAEPRQQTEASVMRQMAAALSSKTSTAKKRANAYAQDETYKSQEDISNWRNQANVYTAEIDADAQKFQQYAQNLPEEYQSYVSHVLNSAARNNYDMNPYADALEDYYGQFNNQTHYDNLLNQSKQEDTYAAMNDNELQGEWEKYNAQAFNNKTIVDGYNNGQLKVSEDEYQDAVDELNTMKEIEKLQESRKLLAYENGIRNNEDYEQYSGVDSSVSDSAYKYINNIDNYREAAKNPKLGMLDVSVDFDKTDEYTRKGLDQLTDEETGVYNYIYNTQGGEAAYEYIQQLPLTQRMTESKQAEASEFATRHPVLASIDSVAQNTQKWKGFLYDTTSMLFTEEADPYNYANISSNVSNAERGTITNNIDNGVAKFLYQTGMSTADFLTLTAMTGGQQWLNLSMMGAGAAADSYIAGKERGLDDKHAYATSVVAGAAEVLTEKFSVEALLDMDVKGWKYIAKNFLTEGTEESVSDVINLIGDTIINGDQSEFRQNMDDYEFKGYSEGEAFAQTVSDWIGDTALDFLGGALSGGVMAGGAVVTGINSNYQDGKAVNNSESEIQQVFIEQGLNSTDENVRAIAEKAQSGSVSNKEMSQLVEAVSEESDVITVITNRLIELGEDTKNAKEKADLILKAGAGNELSNKEQKQVMNDENTTQVYTEVFRDHMLSETDSQRTAIDDALEMARSGRSYQNAPMASTDTAESNDNRTATETPINSKNELYEENANLPVTTMKGTNDRVSIDAVARNGNGDVVVRLDNGEEASVSQLNLSASDAKILDTAKDYSANSASVLLNYAHTAAAMRSDMSVPILVNNFHKFYIYGQAFSGNENRYQSLYNEMVEADQSDAVYQHIVRAAYECGANDKKAEIKAQQEKAESAKTKADPIKSGKNKVQSIDAETAGKMGVSEVVMGTLTTKQKAAVTALNALSDYGMQFRLFESSGNETGNGANGWYDSSTRTVYLDINAGHGTEQAILRTAGHELTHFMKNMAPEKYEAYKNYVVEQLGDSVDELVFKQRMNAERAGVKLSYDQALDEVIADASEMMLRDSKAVENLAKMDESIFKRAYKFVQKFAKSVIAAFSGIETTSAAGKQIQSVVQEWTDIQKIWDDAFEEAIRNNIRSEYKVDIDIQMSARKREYTRTDVSEIDKWDGKNPREHFIVGISGRGLSDIGIDTGKKIIIDSAKIIKIFNDHPEMNNDVIKQIGKAVEDPMIIMKSLTVDGRITLYGNVFDESGKPVFIALELNPNWHGKILLDEIKIASAYVKNNAQNVLNNSDIVWVNPEKNKINNWLKGTRLQLPVGFNQSDLTNSISNTNIKSNTKFSMRTAVEGGRNLIAVHNLDENNLLKTLDLGGFPMPSIAVTKAELGHTNFGDISVLFRKDTIDPANKKNKVYSGDVWSATFPDGAQGQDVEDIVRAMLGSQKSDRNVAGFVGIDSIQAAAAEEFTSINGIKSANNVIKVIDKDEYNSKKRHLGKIMDNIIEDIVHETKGEITPFEKYTNNEAVGNVILEACSNPTVENIQETLIQAGWDCNRAYAWKLAGVIDEAMKMPSLYFEAKPQRIVGFNEVYRAIIPSDSSQKLKEKLTEKGIGYEEYARGDKQERLNIVNQHDEIFFSLRDSDNDSGRVKALSISEAEMNLNIELVHNMKSVGTVKYVGTDGIDNMRDAIDVASSHINKWGSISNDEIGDIEFSSKSIRSLLTHGNTKFKISIIDTIPDVVRNGYIVDAQKNWKGRDYNTLVIAAPITLAGDGFRSGDGTYYAGVVIERTNALAIENVKQKFHVNDILIKKKGINAITASATHSNNGIAHIKSLSLNKILENIADNVKYHEENTEKKQFSLRDSDEFNARTMLSDALMDVAQNEEEKNKLAKYKVSVNKIDEFSKELKEVRAQIRETMFAKGQRNQEKLDNLIARANMLANKINWYDKQLLSLEATKPLKDVVARERVLTEKRMKEKSKQQFTTYKEKRSATALRHKIGAIAKDISNRLLRPTDKKYVPSYLTKAMSYRFPVA